MEKSRFGFGETDSWAYIINKIKTKGSIHRVDPETPADCPELALPMILDGSELHRIDDVVYMTPYGLIPRVNDIATVLDKTRRTVSRYITEDRYPNWFCIDHPSPEQMVEAISNVNDLYTEHFSESDHCHVCNAIDTSLFEENCWLVKTSHDCSEDPHRIFDDVRDERTGPLQTLKILYSFGGKDYDVTLWEWLSDKAPHLEKEQ